MKQDCCPGDLGKNTSPKLDTQDISKFSWNMSDLQFIHFYLKIFPEIQVVVLQNDVIGAPLKNCLFYDIFGRS